MGRHKDELGSWFRIWSKQWLKDEKLIKAGDSIEVAFLRILCLAEECRDDGRLTFRGLSTITQDQMEEAARITHEQFCGVKKLGVLVEQNGTYAVKNWEKWQPKKRKTN
ncbi:MAG: hypothetical protein WC433_01785 [Candidatus Omnitrophota bacterium]|jgi:hypothetical protein